MESRPCDKLFEQIQTVRQQVDDASLRAKTEIVTEPMEPENAPPALQGTRSNEPYEREKEVRKQLSELEKSYQDCLKEIHRFDKTVLESARCLQPFLMEPDDGSFRLNRNE